MPVRIRGYQGSIPQLGTCGAEGANHDFTDGGGQYILGADLDDARLAGFSMCQQRAEIQIVRETIMVFALA